MGTTKVAITMDEAILGELERLEKGRLARECAKLDVRTEQAMAEEGIDRELSQWPPY
jgi:hypothetical protein